MTDQTEYHFTFLRHGQSEGNVRLLFQGQLDFPLSDLGHEQAQALGKRWLAEGREFDAIVASPLSRARQTAGHVADSLGMAVDEDDLWMEQDFGALSEVSIADFVKDPNRPKFFGPYDQSGGYGESRTQLYARATTAIQSLFRKPPGRYLIVSHGALLNMACYHILGLLPQANLEGPRIMFRNTAFAEFSYRRSAHRWQMLTINDHQHTGREEIDLELDLDVYFLRHGESVGNRDHIAQGQGEYPLTNMGRTQARARAANFSDRGVIFDGILASTQGRALETAAAVTEQLGGQIESDPVWMERHNGELAGRQRDDFPKYDWPPDFLGPYTPMAQSGESIWETYLRAGRALEKLVRLENGRYLIVSHGGLINSVVKAALGSVPQANFRGAVLFLQNAGYVRMTYARTSNQWRIYDIQGSPS